MSRAFEGQPAHGLRNRIAVAAMAAVAMNGIASTSPEGDAQAGTDFEHAALSLEAPAAAEEAKDTNVVLILVDDLDMKLMPYMPAARSIGRQGATFTNYRVEQSTCCTSRSTILTGQYTHNTQVFGNEPPEGGFTKFRQTSEATALPTWFGDNYKTYMQGKYLNHYPVKGEESYVPPGWDDWAVPVHGSGYSQTNYALNVNGEIDPTRQKTFLDSVLGERLLAAIRKDFSKGGNFFEWASFAPHGPFAHPKQLAKRFKNVKYPRQPNFSEPDVSDKNRFVKKAAPLTTKDKGRIDETFRDRIRSVQVLDSYIKKFVTTLKEVGVFDNTYLIFTSDNGYLLGEHRISGQKYNQFEEALKVPLMISGPGIAPRQKINAVTGNVDLAPTIAAMTNTPLPNNHIVDGKSLLGVINGQQKGLRRDYMLIGRGQIPTYSHAKSKLLEPADQTVMKWRDAVENDFSGVVGRKWKYIRFTRAKNGERPEELYNLKQDRYEMNNLLADGMQGLPDRQKKVVKEMRRALHKLLTCEGAVECNINN